MNDATPEVLLWRRIDQPGHDHCRLWRSNGGFVLAGTAIFVEAGTPCRLDYQVLCDESWRTLGGNVAGWLGQTETRLQIDVLDHQRWQLNGVAVPAVGGCVDLDLGFTPATNLLAIRRLGLEVGGQGHVRAAWFDWPQSSLQPLEQRYRRISANVYQYDSDSPPCRCELRVNDSGFVLEYPGLWSVEKAPCSGD